jgi:hypothetical protein
VGAALGVATSPAAIRKSCARAAGLAFVDTCIHVSRVGKLIGYDLSNFTPRE